MAGDRRTWHRPRDADRRSHAGQYDRPVRIVAFNTAEGWSRDVTKDIADELRRRLVEYDDVPSSLQAFVETVSRA